MGQKPRVYQPDATALRTDDGWGNTGTIVRAADTLNMSTTYKYDYHNAVIKVTDPEGKYINYTRDYLGNVLSMSPNGGAAWTYTYDDNG